MPLSRERRSPLPRISGLRPRRSSAAAAARRLQRPLARIWGNSVVRQRRKNALTFGSGRGKGIKN
jgi:hypothetical protein